MSDAPTVAAPLLILAGPTGVGKSAIALALAEATGASILSADSMQVYRGMAIGTAQPTAAELAAVRHHLVGHVEPGEEYHVARFVAEADAILAAESAARRPVIVCGGTGLFLRHLIDGIFDGAPRRPDIRARLEAEIAEHGLERLRERLRAVDPQRDAEINANDAVRVIRALEVYEATGVPMSELHRRDRETRAPRAVRYVVIHRPGAELDARQAARVDAMLAAGWLDEARVLMERGLTETAQAAKALGYRELFRHLRGEATLAATRAEIILRTRQFARRQLNWFRGVEAAQWVEASRVDIEALAQCVSK